MLEDIDPEQSQKWDVLWKWYIGAFGVTLLSIFIVFVSAEIGLIGQKALVKMAETIEIST